MGNAVHPPVIRRRTGGPDQAALDALGERRLGDLHRLVPTAAEEAEQLREELAASLAHLQRVDAAYWEREWRREHKGLGVYPEDHRWWPWVDRLRTPPRWPKGRPSASPAPPANPRTVRNR